MALILVSTVGIGEICNFAAYAFAPAILVTPLGALSVLIGAVLGSYFLKEELGTLGKLGSAICLIGAVVIVLHAPPDEDIETIDQILDYALRPGKTDSAQSSPAHAVVYGCIINRVRCQASSYMPLLLWPSRCS